MELFTQWIYPLLRIYSDVIDINTDLYMYIFFITRWMRQFQHKKQLAEEIRISSIANVSLTENSVT